MSTADLAQTIKDLARRMGFVAAGIAPAGPVPRAEGLRDWLERGFCAGMDFLRRNLSQRLCPSELVEGARSVLCLAASYAPLARLDDDGLVARYARGRDYHKVLKRRCDALMEAIRMIEPTFAGRAFVDSSPVMERSLAALAGLGWIGRNGCLFVPTAGSYCVLAEIVCNLPLPPEEPLAGRCGDCRACLAACPTGALKEGGLVDARRCIGYLTIEHRGQIDPAFWPLMGQHLFGCDACQTCCPRNCDLSAGDAELTGSSPLGGVSLAEVLAWRQSDWDRATAASATRRVTHPMFLRNAAIAAGNSSDASLIAALVAMQRSEPRWAQEVRWALTRLSKTADLPFDAPPSGGV